MTTTVKSKKGIMTPLAYVDGVISLSANMPATNFVLPSINIPQNWSGVNIRGILVQLTAWPGLHASIVEIAIVDDKIRVIISANNQGNIAITDAVVRVHVFPATIPA